MKEGNPLSIAYHVKSSTGQPHRLSTTTTRRRGVLAALAVLALSLSMSVVGTARAKENPANIAPPADAVLLFELRANGVQIYTCRAKPDDPASFVWTFKAPEADLFDESGQIVGRHFAGPTWQSVDGSAVKGAVLERVAAPRPGAIPWLLLEATGHEGSGVFSSVTYIQRLATVDGVAPTDGCDADHAGAEARQYYEATYAFYA